MRGIRPIAGAIALTALLATSVAHASVLLTPSNPVAFGAYPAPIFVGLGSHT